MATISWQDFDKVEMRVGRIQDVKESPQARTPSYLLSIDSGPQIGVKKSSAAIKNDYAPEDLAGRMVVAVVNFPPKQVANHVSQVLVLAALNDSSALRLLQPDEGAEIGARIR